MIHYAVLKEGEKMKCQDILNLSVQLVNQVSLERDIEDVYIGESPIYNGVKIGFNINDFFANHFNPSIFYSILELYHICLTFTM